MFLPSILAISLQTAAVEVPFRVGDDAIIVDVKVNGRKASLMFDTGFSGSVVLDESLNIGKATGSMRLRDFVGEFEAKTVKIKSLMIGTLDVNSDVMEAVQQPMAHMSQSYNTHTDGILGFQAVKNHVFEINFQNKKFVFHPRSVDISQRKPDNVKTFLARLLPIGHNSIEMEVVASNGKKMVLALDTGNAFYATTHKDVLERIGLWQSGRKPEFMRQAWVASGPVDSWYASLKDVTIFGVPVKESVWSIIDMPSSSAEGDGTIGFGFLKNFNIIIDMERRRVWLENFTGKVADDAVADVGISAFFDNRSKRFRIVRVTPGGPADKAGIKVGDELLGIDGSEALNIGNRELDRRLSGEPGSKVSLAISRQGNLMRFELERTLLINAL
jgi:predicted aspartyl protease